METESQSGEEKKPKSWLDNFNPSVLVSRFKALSAARAEKQTALKRAVKKKDGIPKSFSTKAGTERDARIYDPFKWVKPVLLWTNLQIVLIALLCIPVWLFVFKLSNRDYMVIDLPAALPQRIEASFDVEKPNMLAALNRYIYTTLTLMNTFSFEQAPNIHWLEGVVNPEIHQEVRKRYSGNLKEIEAVGMLQNLAVTKIEDVFVSFNQKQLTANVKGYLVRTTLPGSGNTNERTQTIPYRARVVVLVQPESKLSQTPFYLLQIAEAAGREDVQRFDRAIAAQKERRDR